VEQPKPVIERECVDTELGGFTWPIQPDNLS
jgi:hypothetical protein